MDANGGYTVEQAVVGGAGGSSSWTWPCSSSRPGAATTLAMAEVRHKCGMPIMADESVFTPQDALEVIRHERPTC